MTSPAPALPASTSQFHWDEIQEGVVSCLVNRVPHLNCLASSNTKPSFFVSRGDHCGKFRDLTRISLLLHNSNADDIRLHIRNKHSNYFRFLDLLPALENFLERGDLPSRN